MPDLTQEEHDQLNYRVHVIEDWITAMLRGGNTPSHIAYIWDDLIFLSNALWDMAEPAVIYQRAERQEQESKLALALASTQLPKSEGELS